MYDFQNTVNTLGIIAGVIALVMLILGFCVPSGKIIILEGLVVVQMGYFSILQFEKMPPTYIGLKSLGLSNGYNDNNMFSGEAQTRTSSSGVYEMMGLKSNFLSNYNLSLILFMMIPTIVGLIGYLVTKNLLQNYES